MFILINTNDATHIAINVPHENSEKTLPALAAMFEENAVFINKGWREIKTVSPSMSVVLGENVVVGDDVEMNVTIPKSNHVMADGFVPETPEVHVNYSKMLKQKDDEITRLRNETNFAKDELARLKTAIDAMKVDDEQ